MKLTHQEIFDKGLAGIRAQGYAKSVSNTGTCRYRGLDGRKCIMGHVLKDEDVTDKQEGMVIKTLMTVKSPSYLPSDKTSIAFMSEMQDGHDRLLVERDPTRNESWFQQEMAEIASDKFEAHMAKIAKDYDLTYTPPEQSNA